MRKLYEIMDDIGSLIELAADDPVAAAAFAEEIEKEGEEKLVTYFHVIKELEGEVLKAKAAIELAQDYKRRQESAIEFLEGRITMAMNALGLKKIDRPDAKITLCEGRDKLLRTERIEEIPPDFKKEVIDYKVDWAAIERKIKEIARAQQAEPYAVSFAGCTIAKGEPYLRYPKLKAE